EDASVTPLFASPAIYRVSAPGGTAAAVGFSARVAEIDDGHPGDVSLAVPVTFSMAPAVSGAPQGCSAFAGTGAGGALTAGCAVNGVPVGVYDVGIDVGGDYYTGRGRGVVAVFDPTLGSVAGGGSVLARNVRVDFNLSMRYVRNDRPEGSLQIVDHRPD